MSSRQTAFAFPITKSDASWRKKWVLLLYDHCVYLLQARKDVFSGQKKFGKINLKTVGHECDCEHVMFIAAYEKVLSNRVGLLSSENAFHDVYR